MEAIEAKQQAFNYPWSYLIDREGMRE